MISDNEIIALFFNRSQEAVKELADKYGKMCMSFSYRILKTIATPKSVLTILTSPCGTPCRLIDLIR